MIESLRKKINFTILETQELKQELYDRISNIDNELLELNEILMKLNDNDAFLKIAPYEAFKILEKLGYTDNKEKMDLYFEIVNSKDISANVIQEEKIQKHKEIKKESVENERKEENKEIVNKIVEYKDYEDKIENSKEELTSEQRKTLARVIEILVENIYDDDYFYYISRCKVSKFRVYYNLSILLSGNYNKTEIFDMVKKAFTYKACEESCKEKIELALEQIKDKIENIK